MLAEDFRIAGSEDITSADRVRKDVRRAISRENQEISNLVQYAFRDVPRISSFGDMVCIPRFPKI